MSHTFVFCMWVFFGNIAVLIDVKWMQGEVGLLCVRVVALVSSVWMELAVV